jgi:hypothetical protein
LLTALVGMHKADVLTCSYDTLFRLPLKQLEVLLSSVKALTNRDPVDLGPESILMTEPGLVYSSLTSFNASLSIKLQDGLKIDIPADEFDLPLRGISTDGSAVTDSALRELQVYRTPLDSDTAVLG